MEMQPTMLDAPLDENVINKYVIEDLTQYK